MQVEHSDIQVGLHFFLRKKKNNTLSYSDGVKIPLLPDGSYELLSIDEEWKKEDLMYSIKSFSAYEIKNLRTQQIFYVGISDDEQKKIPYLHWNSITYTMYKSDIDSNHSCLNNNSCSIMGGKKKRKSRKRSATKKSKRKSRKYVC